MAGMQGEDESPWPSAAQRRQAREYKREAVLKTAVRLFNEKGFHATSLDDVARRLNVTKPTIYHYFKSKDEVLFECCRMGLEQIEAAVAEEVRASGNGRERLRVLMEKYAEIMTQDFGMSLIRTSDADLSEESWLELRRLKSRVDQTLRATIAEGVADGSLAPCDVRLAAFTIAGALNWIALWYDPQGPQSAEELARATAELLLKGLTPRG